jgi:hypothetical protein
MTVEKITVAKIDKEIATFTANRDALKALGHKVAMRSCIMQLLRLLVRSVTVRVIVLVLSL